MGLEADKGSAVAGNPVRPRVVPIPGLELRLPACGDIDVLQCFIGRRLEERADPLDLRCVEHWSDMLCRLPFSLDLVAESGDAHRLHQDLDPRLVDVVPAPIAVVHTQYGVEIGQQIRQRQKLANDLADHGGAAEPATHEYLE